MKRNWMYPLLLVSLMYPILSFGQTVVLTTPPTTITRSGTNIVSVIWTFVGPASSTSLRRYVVKTLSSSQPFAGWSYATVTVFDSLAVSTLATVSDTSLQFAGIGSLYDDDHDELIVNWSDVVYTNNTGNGRSSGFKIIDLQTGGTRYSETGPPNAMVSATLINYSGRTKPDLLVNSSTTSGDISSSSTTSAMKVYRFYTSQTGGIPQSGELPQKMSLSQNYPNPFNPTTTIEYELPSGGSPKIDIFDLNGALICSFDLLGQQAGINRLVWDGKNVVGSQVASGAYFYQLTSGGTTQQKKMLLLR